MNGEVYNKSFGMSEWYNLEQFCCNDRWEEKKKIKN